MSKQPIASLLAVAGALILAACGAPAQPSADTVATATPLVAAEATPVGPLNTEFADAASLRNQLAYGTLLLEGTAQAVTAEQSQALLPLWQAIVALSGTETTAPEELTAVQNQITAAMTTEQLEAIAAQRITNATLSAFYAEHGIVLATPVPGVTKVPGSGSGVSPEDKAATRTAAEALGTPTGSGAGQAAKTFLFDSVIELLATRAAP